MLINPTTIDVDHKGRVWVVRGGELPAEGLRPADHPQGGRPHRRAGGHERATARRTRRRRSTRAPEIVGPLGVCVAPYPDGKGQKVFVCQSPDILVFEDKDGDLKADGPPKKFLTGFGGFDHDHGVHGINIGPDGKLYFTVGDCGVGGLQVERRQGQEVDDQRHRLPEGDRLALRHGRHEPRTDRPQLPQQLRVLRQQLRRGVALGQRRRRQPADAHLLRDARRQLRLRPARPRPDALARGAAGHRPQDAAHRLRQPDRHHRSTKARCSTRSTAARSCTATPARARCGGSTSSRRARATSSRRKCC